MVWGQIKLSVKLENSRWYFWDTLFHQKVLKLILRKLKQLLKCLFEGQLMNYWDFLVWLITSGILSLTLSSIPLPCVTSSKKVSCLNYTIGNLKTLVTSTPCLKIFYSKLPTRLRTDPSSVGLCAFLEQNYGTLDNKKWDPIGYSSRTLRE